MRRWCVLSLLLGYAAWGGCSSERAETTGNGGAAASSGDASQVTTASASGSGSANTCVGGAVDGTCDPLGGENCSCADCRSTAICRPHCDAKPGVCDPLNDACTCPDCFTFHACSNTERANCVDDGHCDAFHEGCNCDDCKGELSCADAIMLCTGGNVGQGCDASEPCGCPDCFGTPKCLPCTIDGTCSPEEPCFCADCAVTSYCKDPANCQNQGICDAVIEGCGCADCAVIPECDGMTP